MKLKIPDGKLRKIGSGFGFTRAEFRLILFIALSVFAAFYAPSEANAKVIVLKAEKKAKKVKRTPFTVSKIKKRAGSTLSAQSRDLSVTTQIQTLFMPNICPACPDFIM